MSKREIKVLFINPSPMTEKELASFLDRSSILRSPNFEMPIGLLSIAGFMQKNLDNVFIKLLDMAKDSFCVYLEREKLLPMTIDSFISSELGSIDFKPNIVGISIMFSTCYSTSLQIIKRIKERWSDVILVCGGNLATNYCRELLLTGNVDYVVRGEGELSFTEFVRKLQNGENNVSVEGVIGRDRLDKKIGELSPMIQNLDELPLAAYELLDLEIYKKAKGVSLMFFRGCPFNCTFCASHTVHGRKLRFRSNAHILNDLKYVIENLGFKKVILQDDLLASQKDEFLALATKISEKYASIEFYFSNGFSVAVLDEEIIDAIIKMRADSIILAIESGSPYTQRNIINKNVSLSKARRLIEYLWKKDIAIYTNFILGFPGETRELMQETIDFINQICVDWVLIFTALPLPGTKIYQEFISRGEIKPLQFDWNETRHGTRGFDTSEITGKALKELVYDTNIKVNFFNNSNLRHGRYKKAIKVFTTIIIDPYPFHIIGRYCRGLAYLGINEKKKAFSDFEECVKWIGTNEESMRLFTRYGDKMPLLQQFFGQGSILGISRNDLLLKDQP